MKKILKLFAVLLMSSVIFAGCSKKEENQVRKPSENIDSSTWVDNLIDGKAAASKKIKKSSCFFRAMIRISQAPNLKKRFLTATVLFLK